MNKNNVPAVPGEDSYVSVPDLRTRLYLIEDKPTYLHRHMDVKTFMLVEKEDDLVRRLEEFLWEFQPDQVILTGTKPYMTWARNDTAYGREKYCFIKSLEERFHLYFLLRSDEKDPYSLLQVFQDRIKRNPKEKQILVFFPFIEAFRIQDMLSVTASPFPKTAQPYKAALVLMGLRQFSPASWVIRHLRAFDSVPNGHGYFLWIVPLWDGVVLTSSEFIELYKTSDQVKRVHRILQILPHI